MLNWISTLKAFDHRRPSLPGEHWMALASGIGLLVSTKGRSSTLGRMAALAAGAALVYRAASGRDGLLGKRSVTYKA